MTIKRYFYATVATVLAFTATQSQTIRYQDTPRIIQAADSMVFSKAGRFISGTFLQLDSGAIPSAASNGARLYVNGSGDKLYWRSSGGVQYDLSNVGSLTPTFTTITMDAGGGPNTTISSNGSPGLTTNGDILPTVTNTQDLGSSSYKWAQTYANVSYVDSIRSITANSPIVIKAGDATRNNFGIAMKFVNQANIPVLNILVDSARNGFQAGENKWEASGTSQSHVGFVSPAWFEDPVWLDEGAKVQAYDPGQGATTLAASASSGTLILKVSVTKDWMHSDQEVEIGSNRGANLEWHRITSVSNDTITLASKLAYTHSSGDIVNLSRTRALYPTTGTYAGGRMLIGAPQNRFDVIANGGQIIEQAPMVRYSSMLGKLWSPFVVSGGAVTARSPASMYVSVAKGIGQITTNNVHGDSVAYSISAVAQDSIAIAAADPTNPRIDLVYWDSSGVVRVATGTPAGSPAVPSTPTNCLSLANIAVAAAASSIVTGNITDTRALNPSLVIPTGVTGIGIGETAPQGLLHVSGTGAKVYIQGANAGQGTQGIQFKHGPNSTSNTGYIGSITQTGGGAGKMVFSTISSSSGERMRIDSTGYVGIGDSSPLYLLTVGSSDRWGIDTSGAMKGGATLRGSDSFTTTATTDTVTVAGGASTDYYFVQATGAAAPSANDAMRIEALTGKFVVWRAASGTSGLTYNWFRIK